MMETACPICKKPYSGASCPNCTVTGLDVSALDVQNSDFPGATAFLVDLVSNRKIPITTPRCKVGRDDLNDIVISGDQSISRFHFVITKENSQYFVQDGKSRHGTFLNGNQITGPEPIHDGDVLKVGVSLFWFVIEAAVGQATSDKTQPVDLARDTESQPSSASISSTATGETPADSGSAQGYDEALAPKPPEWSNNLENLASDSLGYSRQSAPSEPAPSGAKMSEFTDIAAEEFVPSDHSEEVSASSASTDNAPVASSPAEQNGDAESSSDAETASPVAESSEEPAASSEEPSSSGDSKETPTERSSSDSNEQDDSKFKISDNDINLAAERLLESYSDSSREAKSESSAEAKSEQEQEQEQEPVAQATPSTEEREAEAEKTPAPLRQLPLKQRRPAPRGNCRGRRAGLVTRLNRRSRSTACPSAPRRRAASCPPKTRARHRRRWRCG